jgi:hypothetical protein
MMTDHFGIPLEYQERLGLRFYFDTNFITDESAEAERLRELDRDGWINLWRTDTVERGTRRAPPRRP